LKKIKKRLVDRKNLSIFVRQTSKEKEFQEKSKLFEKRQ
jgi:hypothetical protein